MEISSNPSDAEFKTLVTRILKELSEDLKSIKKIQSETKNTLVEIKNNLQGNNSRVDEAKNRMIWNIKQKKNPIRTRRKKINGQFKTVCNKPQYEPLKFVQQASGEQSIKVCERENHWEL